MTKPSEEKNLKSPPVESTSPPDAPHPKVHGSEWAKNKGEEDRVESLIRDSGCWDQHIKTVECMSDKNDWRKCQEEVKEFRQCMTKNRKQFIEEVNKDNKPAEKK